MEEFNAVGAHIRTLDNLIRRAVTSRPAIKQIDRMTGTNAWLIAYIGERTDMGCDVFQRDIEEQFGVTRSAVSRVVTLMESKGMLQRLPVEGDQRLKQLVLTPEARCLSKELKQDAVRMEQVLTRGFSQQERAQLIAYLARIETNLGAQAADKGE